MEFEFLVKHNPWWKDKSEVLKDSKVKLVLSKKNPFIPSLFSDKGCYSIRGPRQVGKTTALKVFLWKYLFETGGDNKQVLYLPCDMLTDFKEIVNAVELHKEWLSRFGVKENRVLFDEITFVKEWHKAVKYLIDQSLCTLLVFTGSSASDLKKGVERFPGRNIETIFYLPLKFLDYAKLFGSSNLKKELEKISVLGVNEMDSSKLTKNASILLPFLSELNALLENFFVTGGFLGPGYEFYENKVIKEKSYEDYVNWILGDLSKVEKSELFFREIVACLVKKYGSPLAFHSIAKETSIGSHKTVAEYLELASNLLLTNSVHKIDLSKKTSVFRKQKKYYFLDPFLFNAFAGYINGRYEDYVNEDNKSFLLEGIVLDHLKRKTRYYKESVWYYKDKKGEVDLVVRTREKFTPIEVKWRVGVNENDFKHYHIFKKPLILSKTEFREGKALIVPASIFIACI